MSSIVQGGYRQRFMPAGLLRQLWLLLRPAGSHRRKPTMTPGDFSSHMRRDIGLDDRPAGRCSDATAFINWDGRRP